MRACAVGDNVIIMACVRLQWVLEAADVAGNRALDVDELKTAVTLWYGHVVRRVYISLNRLFLLPKVVR